MSNPVWDAYIGLGASTGLVFSRLGGFVTTSPWPGNRVGATARLSLVFGLSAIAVPLVPAAFGTRSLDLALVPIAIAEVVIGLMQGFVLRVLAASADALGELLGQATGLSGAQLFDPMAEGHETAISRVVTILSAWMLLASGAHRVALSILLESFRALPVGTSVAPGSATLALVDLTARTLSVGVQMALPCVAVSLAVQVCLAMIARAAPSLQIFNVGFSMLIAGGMLVLIDVLPDMARSMATHYATLGEATRRVLEAATAR